MHLTIVDDVMRVAADGHAKCARDGNGREDETNATQFGEDSRRWRY